MLKSKCVILVTHLTQYAQAADEVIILEKGSIFASGTPQELSRLGHLCPDSVTHLVDDVMEPVTESTEGNDVDGGAPTAGKEAEGTGKVGLGALWKYMRAGNEFCKVLFTMSLFGLNQIVLSGTDLFLQAW